MEAETQRTRRRGISRQASAREASAAGVGFQEGQVSLPLGRAKGPDAAVSRPAGWKIALAGVAILILVGVGYAYWMDARHKAEEEARALRDRADAVRIAAEQRARQLEEQAAADRAARELAEKSRVESLQRIVDQAERDRIAKARAAAFNAASLHRDVRLAVEAARKSARTSEAVAEKARTAAIEAENAAERARNGGAGTIHLTFEGGSYLGEGNGSTRNGYGVSIFREPSKYAGDRYSGPVSRQWS
jgi:hypothetical protein